MRWARWPLGSASRPQGADHRQRHDGQRATAAATRSPWSGEVGRSASTPGASAAWSGWPAQDDAASRPRASPRSSTPSRPQRPRCDPIVTVAVAIGLASGAFSYLNGGDMLGTAAAVVAGGVGQPLRALLLRRRGNQYAVTALVRRRRGRPLLHRHRPALGATGFGPGHAAGSSSPCCSWSRASRWSPRCSTPCSTSRSRR